MIVSNMSAVILAGGKSSRMGEDKSLLQFDGKSLLEFIVSKVAPHFKEVIIMTNDVEKFVDLDLEGCLIYEDWEKLMGPLSGIYSAFSHTSFSQCMVFSCDMPFIHEQMILTLIPHLNSKDYDAYCFQTENGFYQPFPGIYSKRCQNVIRLLVEQKEYSMKRFFSVVDTLFIPAQGLDSRGFLNLNRKEDYEEALQMLEGSCV